jgi:hypothetical protein
MNWPLIEIVRHLLRERRRDRLAEEIRRLKSILRQDAAHRKRWRRF